MTRRRIEGALRTVTGSERIGRRLYLLLACGHRKLHNQRLAAPTRTYCTECDLEGVGQ